MSREKPLSFVVCKCKQCIIMSNHLWIFATLWMSQEEQVAVSMEVGKATMGGWNNRKCWEMQGGYVGEGHIVTGS